MKILFVAQGLSNIFHFCSKAQSPTDRSPYQNSKVENPLVNLRCQGTTWCKFRYSHSCGIEANFRIKSLPLCGGFVPRNRHAVTCERAGDKPPARGKTFYAKIEPPQVCGSGAAGVFPKMIEPLAISQNPSVRISRYSHQAVP